MLYRIFAGNAELQVMPSVFDEGEFQNFNIPTLLLIGDKEVIYPAEKAIANGKRLIPNLKTHLIAGASHSLTMEHADVVNELTLHFLQKENDHYNGLKFAVINRVVSCTTNRVKINKAVIRNKQIRHVISSLRELIICRI